MNVIVFDTETTNGFDDPLCYDVGWTVMTECGLILQTRSFVVADIFLDEPQLMQEAFFANKIPQYFAEIADGQRELRRFKTIRKVLHEDCKTFDVGAIMAHNMSFDYRSTSATQRWLTSSKYRYFFPYGVELWDTLRMARQTFAKDEMYKQFCIENGFLVQNDEKRPQLTAEILYKYISGDLSFQEEHTGLADTMIEREIFMQCVQMNPNIEKKCWA